MRLLLVCCLTMFMSGALSGQEAASAPARDRAELERLEQVWNDAHERGDAAALDQLWAEDLIVKVPGMPVMRKAESLAIWRSGGIKFERYATSELDIQIFGDSAIVIGRMQRQRLASGQRVADDWHFTKVYVRRDGRWRVTAWNASESPK